MNIALSAGVLLNELPLQSILLALSLACSAWSTSTNPFCHIRAGGCPTGPPRRFSVGPAALNLIAININLTKLTRQAQYKKPSSRFREARGRTRRQGCQVEEVP